jgi:hypothetical protein
MVNFGLPQIKLAGEHQVQQWLTENGYTEILKENLHSREYAIKALGITESILVQVRTFLHPHRPFKLSDYEIDLLTRRASKLSLVAYAAYVVLDVTGNLAQEIIWERLS